MSITSGHVGPYGPPVFAHNMQVNFAIDQKGIQGQLDNLRRLIRFFDPRFMDFLEDNESGNLFFMFRWILIRFKREFSVEDTLVLWEVLWTQHLSPKFHLFVCLAIVHLHRGKIVTENLAFDELLAYANSLSGQLNLDQVLGMAEATYRSVAERDDVPSKLMNIIQPERGGGPSTKAPDPESPPQPQQSQPHMEEVSRGAGSRTGGGTRGGGGGEAGASARVAVVAVGGAEAEEAEEEEEEEEDIFVRSPERESAQALAELSTAAAAAAAAPSAGSGGGGEAAEGEAEPEPTMADGDFSHIYEWQDVTGAWLAVPKEMDAAIVQMQAEGKTMTNVVLPNNGGFHVVDLLTMKRTNTSTEVVHALRVAPAAAAVMEAVATASKRAEADASGVEAIADGWEVEGGN